MARDTLPVTPSVVRWARERAYFTIEDARAKFRDIEAWEAGDASPTYPQLEGMSDTFKVPVAVFFFPDPPDVPPIRESFRTLPDVLFEQIPRGVRRLLRKAKAMQINLAELYDGENPAEHFILRDLRFTVDMNVSRMAARVRNYLGISINDQVAWPDSDTAFEEWRATLEAHGVFVFKDAFQNDAYSGFCLYDEAFPLIYINNSVKTRQMFTLFHELAHLLFHTSGINSLAGDPLEELPPSDRQLETVCNQFAAEFLLPEAQFERVFAGRPASEATAEFIAQRFHVSREFVFRRFLDRGLVTSEEYGRAARKWADQRGGGIAEIGNFGPVEITAAYNRT